MTRQPVTAPGRSSHQPSGFGRISSRLHLLRPGRGAHLANRAAARSGTRHACVPVGSPLPTHSARGCAARVGAGPRVPRGCRNGGYGRSAPMAARGSRRSVRGSRTRPCVPSQHWRGTVMGSAAHRLHDARDRVTESTRRAGVHNDARIEPSTHLALLVTGLDESSGAACRSTSHTAHPAWDTHRVLRGHRRLLRRPAGLSRCAELRRSQVPRMAGDVFLPSTPALVRTHQAPPTGGVPHCCGGRGGRRWRRAGSPALAPTLSPEVDASGRGRA